jgi:hypothetical protein
LRRRQSGLLVTIESSAPVRAGQTIALRDRQSSGGECKIGANHRVEAGVSPGSHLTAEFEEIRENSPAVAHFRIHEHAELSSAPNRAEQSSPFGAKQSCCRRGPNRRQAAAVAGRLPWLHSTDGGRPGGRSLRSRSRAGLRFGDRGIVPSSGRQARFGADPGSSVDRRSVAVEGRCLKACGTAIADKAGLCRRKASRHLRVMQTELNLAIEMADVMQHEVALKCMNAH